MNHTIESINEYLSVDEHILYQWNEGDHLEIESGILLTNHMALFVVKAGKMVIQTDCNIWEMSAGDLVFLAYDKDVRVLSRDDDYRSVGICFARKYWNDILMNINPSIYAARLYPVIPAREKNKKVLIDFMNEVRSLTERGREGSDPLIINCILGLFYHLGKTYDQSINEKPAHSHVRLLSDFAVLLNAHYKEYRDVQFYADGLHMSRSYFSSVILQLTGFPAGACIKKYTALKVCQILKDSRKSIKEIAIDLNFTSASNFCKFFRGQMGVSPEEYRIRYHKRLENFH